MLSPERPLAVYMEKSLDGPYGKMGFGVLRYSPNPVVAVIDSAHVGRNAREFGGDRDVPVVATVAAAREKGAEVLVLGIAPLGGSIPEAWYRDLDHAVGQGMSLVNGLHDRLAPRYPAMAVGQWVWDIRQEPVGLGSGNGAAAGLSNRRVLMIGTDMAVGKMTAGLEIFRLARQRGVRAAFIATGQIGITVTGAGIPLDAIRVDFASGAVEREVMRAAEADLVIIEGQGALCHPGSTANLPLLRGGCPTDLILCLKLGQTALRTHPEIHLPPLGAYCRLYEDLAAACGTFPRPRTVGIAVNGNGHSAERIDEECARLQEEVGLPAADPVFHGSEKLLQAVLA
jgi:uncharacterized NAD-dependent epimerase/dehydratase family protein